MNRLFGGIISVPQMLPKTAAPERSLQGLSQRAIDVLSRNRLSRFLSVTDENPKPSLACGRNIGTVQQLAQPAKRSALVIDKIGLNK